MCVSLFANDVIQENNLTIEQVQEMANKPKEPSVLTKVVAAAAAPVYVAGAVVSFAVMSPFIVGGYLMDKLKGAKEDVNSSTSN